MIQVTEEQREQIKRGNWTVFLGIIKETDAALARSCRMKKDDIRHTQGQAYYSDELCKLLGISED